MEGKRRRKNSHPPDRVGSAMTTVAAMAGLGLMLAGLQLQRRVTGAA